jgi:hypothetical protein
MMPISANMTLMKNNEKLFNSKGTYPANIIIAMAEAEVIITNNLKNNRKKSIIVIISPLLIKFK